jgi:uncharacterized protein YecE (DUF72 family)
MKTHQESDLQEPSMAKTTPEIRVGTSGWHYDHWIGCFYPPDTPKDRWLEHYAGQFDTVELNNTFYQLPREKNFLRWKEQTGEGFVFAVKANRYITHVKKLKDASAELKRFFRAVNTLGKKLGPVLYQLPPQLHLNLELLEGFLRLLPKRKVAVFEFRHKSWFCDETFEMLRKYKAAFCIHDMPEVPTPRVITANSVYIRFHGPTGCYTGSYTDGMLAEWAGWIEENRKGRRRFYAYFNNDIAGHAVENARQLLSNLK